MGRDREGENCSITEGLMGIEENKARKKGKHGQGKGRESQARGECLGDVTSHTSCLIARGKK